MRILFLGTGAADWRERLPDGEFRRFSSALFDGVMLIDLTHSILDLLPEGVSDVVYTHGHADHFSLSVLAGVKPARAHAEAGWADAIDAPGVRVCALRAGERAQIAGFTVTPMPANHSTGNTREQTLCFLIEKGDTRVLYATDGAWLTNAAYHTILEAGALDAAIFDGTVGDAHEGDFRLFEHNSLGMVRLMRAAMRSNNMLKPGARVFVTHLARTLHPCQALIEAREAASGDGLIITYDGMSADI